MFGQSGYLATGSSRKTPPIKEVKEYEGHGVSYCAVCDAFFYKGKDVAVLGEGDYALHKALELLLVANSVTILTNGKEPAVDIPEYFKVITDEIDYLSGGGLLQTKIKFWQTRQWQRIYQGCLPRETGQADYCKY
jgi:thioredoxin reductase (NADPH)